MLSALAAVTRHIGLIATASASYSEPYNIARAFASLDHISKGRAGWNVVTSAMNEEAMNFGRDANIEHAVRYERAAEFLDVAKALWDSVDDEALLFDKRSGSFADPEPGAPDRPRRQAFHGAWSVERTATSSRPPCHRTGRIIGRRPRSSPRPTRT